MQKNLVINNDVDTMSLLKDPLEKKSFEVKYSSSGEESLQLAKKFEPDLVLIDVLQKGYIKDFKVHDDTARIPIISMTGYSWNNEKINETDADDFIEKPFFMEQLQQKIQSTIMGKVFFYFVLMCKYTAMRQTNLQRRY